MERFKACEKEMKTKAFSKEGLSAGHKLDPKEQLKAETANFVSAQVEELARQVETTEAEIELLQGGAKKSKKSGGSGQDKISQLEDLNDRRAWHISRLELILRLIENGNLDPDRIVSLKEDIGYFVESNTVSRPSQHLRHGLSRIF
jgi:CCR4-NOT transcription complex subunit 3